MRVVACRAGCPCADNMPAVSREAHIAENAARDVVAFVAQGVGAGETARIGNASASGRLSLEAALQQVRVRRAVRSIWSCPAKFAVLVVAMTVGAIEVRAHRPAYASVQVEHIGPQTRDRQRGARLRHIVERGGRVEPQPLVVGSHYARNRSTVGAVTSSLGLRRA